MVQKTYDRQTAKFIATVAENLPELSGVHMQRWIGNPKGLQRSLHKALVPSFAVWKTIKLGVYKTADEYLKAMKSAGINLTKLDKDILSRAEFIYATEEIDVGLVILSVAELGFKGGAEYSDICDRALEMGLELCPAEVAPALRLAYTDQSLGEEFIVAMSAIANLDGVLTIFGGEYGNGELWLYDDYGTPDAFWDPGFRFVFVLPR